MISLNQLDKVDNLELNGNDVIQLDIIEEDGSEHNIFQKANIIRIKYLDNNSNIVDKVFKPKNIEDPLYNIWQKRVLSVIDKNDWTTMNDPISSIVKNQSQKNIYHFKDTGKTISATDSFCFSKCSNLSSFDCPNMKVLGNGTFDGCSSLQRISIPNVSAVSDALTTFRNCSKLENIYIDNNILKSIDNGFGENDQLVVDYNRLTSTGYTSAKFISPNCTKLSNDSVVQIPGSIFSAAAGKLTDVYLKNITADIPINVFHSTNSLSNIQIDSSRFESITNGFDDNKTVVVTKDDPPKLVGFATGITRLSNDNIGSILFGCQSTANSLDQIFLKNSSYFNCDEDGRIVRNSNGDKLYFASQTLDKDELNRRLSEYSNLTCLGQFSLSRHWFGAAVQSSVQNSKNTLSLDNIEYVEKSAFDYSTIPFVVLKNVTSIDSSAFSSLKCVSLSAPELTSIPASGFAYGYYSNAYSGKVFTYPTDVYMPKLKYIGTKGFMNRSGLVSAEFNEVQKIEASSFYQCKQLQKLVIPNCSYIGSNAFYRAGSSEIGSQVFKELVLSNSMTIETAYVNYKSWGLPSSCSCFCKDSTVLYNGNCYDSSLGEKIQINIGASMQYVSPPNVSPLKEISLKITVSSEDRQFISKTTLVDKKTTEIGDIYENEDTSGRISIRQYSNTEHEITEIDIDKILDNQYSIKNCFELNNFSDEYFKSDEIYLDSGRNTKYVIELSSINS